MLRTRVLEQESGLAREENSSACVRSRRDHRLAVRRRLEHRSAEADALVWERDDVERTVDLARLCRERQKRKAIGKTLRGDEILDRRLLVREEVGERECAPADRLE